MAFVRGKLEGALIAGEADGDELMKQIRSIDPTWKTFVPSYIGGGSLAAFLIGLGITAAHSLF